MPGLVLHARGRPFIRGAEHICAAHEVLDRGTLVPLGFRFLKGMETEWDKRAAVEYFVRGANVFRTSDKWPPTGVQYKAWHLQAGPSGSVTSLNDGVLSASPSTGEEKTSYSYPNPGWVPGVV